jgi:hypothetical protein
MEESSYALVTRKLYLFKRLVSLPFAFVYMLFSGPSIKENFQMLASLPIDPKNPKPQIDYKETFSLVGCWQL